MTRYVFLLPSSRSYAIAAAFPRAACLRARPRPPPACRPLHACRRARHLRSPLSVTVRRRPLFSLSLLLAAVCEYLRPRLPLIASRPPSASPIVDLKPDRRRLGSRHRRRSSPSVVLKGAVWTFGCNSAAETRAAVVAVRLPLRHRRRRS
jgi:hypothetical protein